VGSTLTKPAAVLYDVYHGACELFSCVAGLSFCFSSCVALDLLPLCVLCCCVPILAVKRLLFWFSCSLSLSLSLCYLQSVSQGIFVFVSPLACVFEYRNSYRDLGLRDGERDAEL